MTEYRRRDGSLYELTLIKTRKAFLRDELCDAVGAKELKNGEKVTVGETHTLILTAKKPES